MNEAFRSDLQQIWTLRNAQKLDAAEVAYKDLYSRSQAFLEQPADWRLELKLLEASLLRGRRRIEDSEARLLEAKNEIEKDSLKIPFQYYCQRGLNLFYQGYFPSALEFFTRAQELAETAEQKALAVGNHFLCLDNLNLPAHSAVEKLRKLQPELPEKYYTQAIHPQLETFERRQAFREGLTHKVLAPLSATEFSQAHYVQLWVSQLPYVNSENQKPDLTQLIEAPHFLWKKYRLRTLLLDARYDDEESVKISERVDRLYTWLWKWMASPGSLSAKVLEETWEALDPCEICSQTTAEDFVLLRLCLRWARLFDARWEIPSQEWLKKSTPPNLQDPPLFQFESLVLDYLEELKRRERSRARTALAKIEAHPFYQDSGLHFRDLIDGVQGNGESSHPLFALGERLANSFKTKTLAVTANTVVIDLQSFQWSRGNLEGVSKPLCLLLKVLHEKGNLSFDELMQLCFSISSYDEDLHRHKIMNLLTRVRKVLPSDFEIFTRNQWMYSKGQLKKIRFENREGERAKWELPRIFERPCLEQNQHHMDRWIQPQLVVKKLKGKTKVTRQELQDLLQISKATTNRLIRRWQDEGFLLKQESGRSICYVIDNTYFFRLNSHDS
ncbi:hypothetical protein [Bdellovibrio sp. HCB337]|uniref:hypothetical protein n=1 Tax=Bdellovibrio sp. HCB337 TaxID=3394358 RepID=UPI0039A5A2CF